jgi:hypothetical protein
MSDFENFDSETLAILEGVLDEACASMQAGRNGNITRTTLAKRIQNLADKGERNPARLLDGALAQRFERESQSVKEAERNRLERSLEEGLQGTFPASDAIAVVQPAPSEPHNDDDR